MKTRIEKPEQTLKLSECNQMMKVIAGMHLKNNGAYYCMYNGKRTKVIK
ncbi:MAG: hypothetical protein WC401_12945 [Bacteroidales bacterium]